MNDGRQSSNRRRESWLIMAKSLRTTLVPIACLASLALGLSMGGWASRDDTDTAETAVESTSTSIHDPDYVTVETGAAIDAVPDDCGWVRPTGFDDLGRTLTVDACVTPQLAQQGSDRERRDINQIHPSGWPDHNDEVTITDAGSGSNPDYHGWLFNRSHLVAKSLGGPDEANNLITGTRTENVGRNDGDGGMAWAESRTRDYLKTHPDSRVRYIARPDYTGNELVARTVTVDVRSADGELDWHITVYNEAKGFAIDYATGDWSQTQ